MVVKVVKMKMITRVMSLILIIHLIVAELQKVSGPRELKWGNIFWEIEEN